MHSFYYYMGLIGYGMHLSLPDYDHTSWLAWRWIGLFCLLCLFLFQKANPFDFMKLKGFFWLILALMKIYTLLALRDVLTQSFFLVCYCLLFAIYHFQRASHDNQKFEHHHFHALRSSVLTLTASVYFLAALHKINQGFLLTDQSCALHGVGVVVDYFSMPETINFFAKDLMIGPIKVVALVVVLWELALAYFVLRQHLIAVMIAVPFHLPLTLTIAPAFGLVMFSGLAFCFKTEQLIFKKEQEKTPEKTLEKPYKLLLYFVLIASTFIFVCSRKWPDLLAYLKVCIYLSAMFLAFYSLKTPQVYASHTRIDLKSKSQIIPIFFLLHGLIFPYLGIEMQHSGAMLSNLRIDPPCHNSLIFPKLAVDPYFYLDEVRFAQIQTGEPAQRAQIMQNTLWNWTAFHTMRTNWCGSDLEPIFFRGHYQGQNFEIQNLCEMGALEHLGSQLKIGKWELPQWQRFQKNLTKNCQEACVH